MIHLSDAWLQEATKEPAFIRIVCEYWINIEAVELSWIQLLTGTQTANNQRSRLLHALSILTSGGFVHQTSTDLWGLSNADYFDLQVIVGAMSGLIWAQKERVKNQPRLIVTLPVMGALSRVLASVGYKESRHDRTDAFIRGSMGKSKKRFVIMTPFMDAVGAKWALETFEGLAKHVDKIIISRFVTGHNDMRTSSGLKAYSREFSALDVKLLELSISASDTLFLETFHAKLLLVDDHTAYVGSSNFTKISQEKTLELGVSLYGKDAKPVVDLLNALMQVSIPVAWGTLKR